MQGQRDASKRYRSKNPDAAKAAVAKWRQQNLDSVYAKRREWRGKNLVRALFLEAKSRAKKRGVEFSITLDDIPPMGNVCPLLGRPFSIGEGRCADSPSLDRIDSTEGYVKGNVWIVGYRANLIKNDGTAEEHQMIASAMKRAGVS